MPSSGSRVYTFVLLDACRAGVAVCVVFSHPAASPRGAGVAVCVVFSRPAVSPSRRRSDPEAGRRARRAAAVLSAPR